MAWYWWIGAGILGLNGLVVAMIVLFLVADWFRARRAASEEGEDTGKRGAAEQGG